jgi:hypothetical protein
MSVRLEAAALLDALGVGTDNDATAADVRRAQSLAGCFVGDHDPLDLVRRLDLALSGPTREALGEAASLSKVCRYPLGALAWALADHGSGPGQLQRHMGPRESGQHPWASSSPTAFGAVLGWWMEPQCPRGTMVLSGETGCGKTVAAVYLAIMQSGRFIRAAELGEMALGKAEASIESLRCEPMLLIDELGRESDIRPTPQRITDIVQSRHDAGLVTLITTQLPVDHPTDDALSFSKRYGHHLVDRVDRGGGRWFSLAQQSRRTGARPVFADLHRSCMIADLVGRVESLTGIGEATRPGDVRALIELTGVDGEAVEAAKVRRIAMVASLRREAAELGEGETANVVTSIIERLASGG